MLAKIRNKVLSGKRLTEAEALNLFKSDDIFSLASLASHIAEKKNGKKAYFVRNRHINPTNICVNRCRFCAFSRSKGQEGAYEMTVCGDYKEATDRNSKTEGALQRSSISSAASTLTGPSPITSNWSRP